VWTIRAVAIDHQVAGPAADVDQRDAELLLVALEHGLRGRERLEDDVGDLEVAAVGALDDVLRRGDRRGDDVDPRLEAHGGHPQRVADAVLVIDDVLLRQDVEHLAVHRDRDRLGLLDDACDVDVADFPCP